MNWFHHLKISVKFAVCFSLVLGLLLAMGVLGLVNIKKINNNMVDLYDNKLVVIKELGDISSSFHRINTYMGNYLLNNNAEDRGKMKDKIAANQKMIDASLASLSNRSLPEEYQNELGLFTSLWAKYKETSGKVIEMADSNQDKIARTVYEREMIAKVEGIDQSFQQFVAKTQEAAETSYTASAAMYKSVSGASILFIIVSFLVSGVMGYLVTSSIVSPIRQLLRHFEKMSSGDLSESIRINRKDELGLLAKSSEHMRSSIAGIVNQVKSSLQSLTGLSDTIRASADSTGESSLTIRQGLRAAADHSRQQLDMVTGDVAIIKEMSSGLQQMASDIDKMNHQSMDMEKASDEGELVVRDAIEQMGRIHRHVQQSAETVENLSRLSREIDGVINSIKHIAEETNLLALNASIEAARAGEAGRGFAVVASEVRKLAESSREAADRVSSNIGKMQESMTLTVQSIKGWSEEITAGQDKVERVSLSFQNMREWTQKLNQTIQDVSAGIEELAAGSQEMNYSMKRIEDFSMSVSHTTEQYASTSDLQVESMNQVMRSVESLLLVSGELQQATNRFVTGDES